MGSTSKSKNLYYYNKIIPDKLGWYSIPVLMHGISVLAGSVVLAWKHLVCTDTLYAINTMQCAFICVCIVTSSLLPLAAMNAYRIAVKNCCNSTLIIANTTASQTRTTGASYIIMDVFHVGGGTGGLQINDVKSIEISPARGQPRKETRGRKWRENQGTPDPRPLSRHCKPPSPNFLASSRNAAVNFTT